jgi:hypothetical protein
MSTFGLVHGGGFGAWCWDAVVPELEARGHRAATVGLTPDDMAAGAVARTCRESKGNVGVHT